MKDMEKKWSHQQVVLDLHGYKRAQHDSVPALSAVGLGVFSLKQS